MKFGFIAGFGPIVREGEQSRQFWQDGGFALEEIAPDYYGTDDVDGVKAFALWPLAQAAENTFGTADWPADLPIPQAWIELDVESPEAVGEAAAEMVAAGHRLLREAREEEWKQTTARLLSPRGCSSGSATRHGCTAQEARARPRHSDRRRLRQPTGCGTARAASRRSR